MMRDPMTPAAGPVAATRRPSAHAQKSLLVASSGGHIDELHRLRERIKPTLDAVEWVTFDTPQTRSLLRGEQVHYVPHVHPRDLSGTAKNTIIATRLVRPGRYDRVISTGAAVAAPYLAVARARGLRAYYIESAARSDGVSMTGRIAATIPGVRLFHQYEHAASTRWMFRGSVFDGFLASENAASRGSIERVVITFGTQSKFGFRSAIERLAVVLPAVCAPSAEILWQTGTTDLNGIEVDAVESVSLTKMKAAVRDADLVISHAGVGSALLALDHGKCPVLLPRSKSRKEHTDDHQALIAKELARRRLAVSTDPAHLGPHHLIDAACRSVRPATTVPPLRLDDV